MKAVPFALGLLVLVALLFALSWPGAYVQSTRTDACKAEVGALLAEAVENERRSGVADPLLTKLRAAEAASPAVLKPFVCDLVGIGSLPLGRKPAPADVRPPAPTASAASHPADSSRPLGLAAFKPLLSMIALSLSQTPTAVRLAFGRVRSVDLFYELVAANTGLEGPAGRAALRQAILDEPTAALRAWVARTRLEEAFRRGDPAEVFRGTVSAPAAASAPR